MGAPGSCSPIGSVAGGQLSSGRAIPVETGLFLSEADRPTSQISSSFKEVTAVSLRQKLRTDQCVWTVGRCSLTFSHLSSWAFAVAMLAWPVQLWKGFLLVFLAWLCIEIFKTHYYYYFQFYESISVGFFQCLTWNGHLEKKINRREIFISILTFYPYIY